MWNSNETVSSVKFVSSTVEVMEFLPSELRENEHKFLAKNYSEKPFGIKWHSTNDVCVFKVGHDLKMILTKHFLLSKVCYPMGWLPSMTLPLSYNMQSSWFPMIWWGLFWNLGLKFIMRRSLTNREMLWKNNMSYMYLVMRQKQHTPVASISGTRRPKQSIFLRLNQDSHHWYLWLSPI